MKIGVDIRTLSFRRGGISRYTYNLLKNIIKIDSRNSYYLFNYHKSPYEWINLGKNVKEIVLRLPQRYGLKTFWENVYLPTVLKKIKIDLWFGPDFTIPKLINIPSLITVHDLIFMKFHNLQENKLSQEISVKVHYSIKKSNKIIVPSNFTREQVLKEFNVKDHKIVVIPEAADEYFHRIDNQALISRVLNQYNIHFPYILFVGETSKRKNLIRLLKAFYLLKSENKIDKRKLLIVGKRTIDTDYIIEESQKLNISRDVIFTDYIPDNDLPFLYNGADVFVFPSLYEGFGIPPLEAMQCETPVAASNITSIPEVVGNGAVLFDPYDVTDISEKIDLILNSRIDLVKLKKNALRQAQNFSWERSSRETLSVIESFSPAN